MRVVVLGGSSGLGLATAQKAASEGWDVVIVSRQPSRANVKARQVALDATNETAVKAFFSGLGPIDHLVSSTALMVTGPAKTIDLTEPHRLFETKFWGPIAAVQAADIRRSVVLMSGASAWTPTRGSAFMAAVNGAVEAIVRTLAVELAPVRVNAIAPGLIDTPLHAALPSRARDAEHARLASALPVGRIGTAAEVADGIWHLLTNGFVTGTVLQVDGGHRLAAP